MDLIYKFIVLYTKHLTLLWFLQLFDFIFMFSNTYLTAF